MNRLLVVLVGLSLILSGRAMAQEAVPAATDDAAAATATMSADAAMVADSAAAAVEGPMVVGNKMCPVDGAAIGSMGEPVTVEYNGKTYSLCCAKCVEEFNKDPEKYSKAADDEVANAASDMMDNAGEAMPAPDAAMPETAPAQ